MWLTCNLFSSVFLPLHSDSRLTPNRLYALPNQPACSWRSWINSDVLVQHPVGAAHPSVHHVREAEWRREFGKRRGWRGQHRSRNHLHRQASRGCSGTVLQETLRRWRDHTGEEERRGRTGIVRDEDEGGAARWRWVVLLWSHAVDSGPWSNVAEHCTEDPGYWHLDRSATR